MLTMWVGLLITSSLFLFLPTWRRQIKRHCWRKSVDFDRHYSVYQHLYADVNGFSLSHAARAGQDTTEYVYGEIDFESFIALLSLCKPKSTTVFYDLGSGTGKAVLACIMVFNVQKSCGVELFSSLHCCAQQQQQRLKNLPDYQSKAERIEFRLGNLLNAQFSDADLIFINATAFFGESWIAISKLMEQSKPGALIISTSKALHSSLFTICRVTYVKMSWGPVKAYIQQRSVT